MKAATQRPNLEHRASDMNPNSTALSNLSNVSLRASSPAGNASAAPAAPTPGTPIAPGSTEFSRMLASNQASARQAIARQNNALNQGKLTAAPKTPDAQAQPMARQASANGNANASKNTSGQAREPQAMNDAAEPSATQTPVRSERDAGKPADADGARSDEPESVEASETSDAVSDDVKQTHTTDPAALAVPVAVFVPTTVSLAQAPQLPAAAGTNELQTLTATQAQQVSAAAADTPLSPSAEPQDPSRQDFNNMTPEGLPLAASSAPGAREAAAEASLAALGRGELNETRSRTLAAFDAAQPGVFALPGAGAAAAARGSEMPAPVQANVTTPFAETGFQQALGYQVSLLARDGIGQAELHLNPADMGPVSVQITMTGDQARVDFGADLAQTRQALEAGWAELASSLKDAGFTLSGGGVSDHARERQAQQGQAASQSSGGRTARESGEADVPDVAPVVARRFNGAVDVYA
jgi:flagellar hook-length control protein FliK